MKKVRAFLSLIVLSILLCSCKKEKINKADCRGAGCKTMYLNGKVLDASLNEGIRNIEVKAHFYQYKSNCFICIGTPVETTAKTKTDNLGNFKMSIIVDTNLLNGNYHYIVDVYAAVNADYIEGNDSSFYNFAENITNITLRKYKKTKLYISLKRELADTFKTFDVAHYFYDNTNGKIIDPTNQQGDFYKMYSPNIADTNIIVFTGANAKTVIYWRKFISNTNVLYRTDSIFCSANIINNYTIKY